MKNKKKYKMRKKKNQIAQVKRRRRRLTTTLPPTYMYVCTALQNKNKVGEKNTCNYNNIRLDFRNISQKQQ